MELLSGEPLNVRLDRGSLSFQETVQYGLQLASALAHAHENGVVHRDFKSGNVVLTRGGHAKVLDFGLANRLEATEFSEATTGTQESLMQPGVLAGTLAYIAPEQYRGKPADERSDLWALGIVLYEMVTGTRPFDGQTQFELTSAILNENLALCDARFRHSC